MSDDSGDGILLGRGTGVRRPTLPQKTREGWGNRGFIGRVRSAHQAMRAR